MAQFHLDVTATSLVLRRLGGAGSRLEGRFDIDEGGMRRLISTIRREVNRNGSVSGISHTIADPAAAKRLIAAIEQDESCGGTLRALARDLAQDLDPSR